MAKLIVNAFYGNIRNNVGNDEDSILDINLDPFTGSERGAVPTFLLTPLTPLVRDGVKAKHGQVTGEQISRSLSYFAVLETLKTLSQICTSVDESIQVNIRKCGRLGNYSLRFLIGLPNVKVNFIDFPTGWAKKLKDLQPITEIMSHVIRHPQNRNADTSNIVSFDFTDEELQQKPVAIDTDYDVEEDRPLPSRSKSKGKRPVVQEEVRATTLVELMEETEEAQVEELAEAVAEIKEEVPEVEDVIEEVKPVKKRATRTKKEAVVEETPAAEETPEEEIKPVKKRASRAKKAVVEADAVPATEEQLAQLAAKHNI